jgi:hypothetical protein
LFLSTLLFPFFFFWHSFFIVLMSLL